MNRLCEIAGVEGNFRNHSLRATSITRMNQAKVPEQEIKEFSGHRSSAVRTYKHTS